MTRYRLNYLARRNPDLSHPAFVARWRQHGRLAASLKEWSTVRRYIQCEVLDDGRPRQYDGAATVEYHSLEARNANRGASAYHRVLQEDEREVFESLVSNFSFIGVHEVLDGSGMGPFKVIRYLKRTAGLSQAAFEHCWRGRHVADIVATAGAAVGYAQNLPIAPERAEGWGLSVDGSEEIWFASQAGAVAFCNSEALREHEKRFAEHFETTALIVADEVVLHDR